ncbi:MAG: hypothetical protein QM723_28765 [Myxococcaceae bacterium]
MLAALALLLTAAPVAKHAWSAPSHELMEEGWARGEPGEWKTTSLDIDGVAVRVLLEKDKAPKVSDDQLIEWVATRAKAVAVYYGKFPVPDLVLRIERDSGGGVGSGVTYQGRRIRIDIGRETSVQELADDWVLVHEFFHLGFPDLDDDYLYLEEGLSTYLEPIARTRAGLLPASETWRSYVDGLPKGMPRPGDRGLDVTHNWGNTYWGGCRFWLLADLEIREKTHNTKSLDDAIRALVAEGGTGQEHWSLEKVIEVGDKATGTTVLRDLHGQMGGRPVRTDLDALWKKLGVREAGEEIVFDDDAPKAALRKSIAK